MTFLDSLHFASAVVLSGNNYSKIEQFARFYRLNIVSRSTFHGYQRNYICTGVDKFYKDEQVPVDVFSMQNFYMFSAVGKNTRSVKRQRFGPCRRWQM